MGGLGVHFSFPAGRGERGCGTATRRPWAFVGELKERWDPYYLQQTEPGLGIAPGLTGSLADGTLA